jgi:hypothetical protein
VALLAYADPPYFGNGRKHYKNLHEEAAKWDSIEAHIELLQELDGKYDGWAMSATSTSIKLLAPHLPESARIAAWVKPFASWKPTQRIQFTWEPVFFKSARPKGGKHIKSVRDHISANIAMRKGLPGAKPDAFCDWILEILGYEIGDAVEDLFPGTESLQKAIEKAQNFTENSNDNR